MELKCPQCGKWMAVSQEELVLHDCQVVCPQCLAVCQYEGGNLVVRDDSDAPYRHNAAVESTKTETAKFCHSCGKQLPEGISFCPYCGANLNAPFDTPKPKPVAPKPEPKPQPKSQPLVKQEPVKPVAKKPEPEATPRRETSSLVEEKLRTVGHQYHSVHPHLHQNGTMPGTFFKIVAYTVIVLLLILLVFIIVAGANIEPAAI